MDLYRRMDNPSWEIIAERCLSIRQISAAATNEIGLSGETAICLSALNAQMRNLGNLAEGVRFRTRNREPDIARIGRVIADQSESVAKAAGELRQRLGEPDER